MQKQVIISTSILLGLQAQAPYSVKVAGSNHCCALVSVIGAIPTASSVSGVCDLVRASAVGKSLVYGAIRRENARVFTIPRDLNVDSYGSWNERYLQYLKDKVYAEAADVLATETGCRLRVLTSRGVETHIRVNDGSSKVHPRDDLLFSSVVYVHVSPAPSLTSGPRYGSIFVSSDNQSEFIKRASAWWPDAVASSFEFVVRPDHCFGQYPYFPIFHPLEQRPPCPSHSLTIKTTVCETLGSHGKQWTCREEPLRR